MAQKGIRREKGSGSVFLRSNGKYFAKYPIGRNIDGEIQYKSKTFSTKKEAMRWLEEQKELYKTLSGLDIQVMTVEEYMDKWLYTNKVNELKPTSFDRVEQVYKFQVLPHIGKIQISQLKSDDIQKMITSLKESGYSYSTIKKAYECCNNCFTTGVKQRTLAFNPCEGVTIPRKSQFAPKPIRFYTEEEEEIIILAARSVYSNSLQIKSQAQIGLDERKFCRRQVTAKGHDKKATVKPLACNVGVFGCQLVWFRPVESISTGGRSSKVAR